MDEFELQALMQELAADLDQVRGEVEENVVLRRAAEAAGDGERVRLLDEELDVLREELDLLEEDMRDLRAAYADQHPGENGGTQAPA